eukprot:Trichotokara_eunicae@DN3202_c0_g1_i1.p1
MVLGRVPSPDLFSYGGIAAYGGVRGYQRLVGSPLYATSEGLVCWNIPWSPKFRVFGFINHLMCLKNGEDESVGTMGLGFMADVGEATRLDVSVGVPIEETKSFRGKEESFQFRIDILSP